MKALDYFMKYCKIETTSDEKSKTCPSTKGQLLLANEIKKDMVALGFKPIIDDNGYLYLHIIGNAKGIPFGLCCHFDTSCDVSGKDCKPNIILKYDGSDIILKDNIVINPTIYNHLSRFIGDDIITTDGTTLLGADDKAGIAQIMGFFSFLAETPNFLHPDLYICLTPDEEIGRGVDKINLNLFNVQYAYTIDSGIVGSIDYECFNAAGALVKIKGKAIHPGSAKGLMVNACELAYRFHESLPKNMKPEFTSGYEGFNHLCEMTGEVEQASLRYIIRNHDRKKFELQKKSFEKIAKEINKDYSNSVKVIIKDSYYNMYDKIKEDFFVVENAIKAMESLNITPYISPIRGGTDGARLSYLGILTPNLGTGAINFHSRAEVLSINQLNLGVELLKEITKNYLR